MSRNMVFGCGISDHNRLRKVCDRLRAQGHAVEGPNYVTNHPSIRDRSKTVDGYAVQLPGWRSPAVFLCNPAGEMQADNYSDYHDDRVIDPLTGNRINGTGEVHPDVAAGRKRVGEDGKWGDIKWLNRVVTEYGAIGLEEATLKAGGRAVSRSLNEQTQVLELVLEFPE